MNKDQLRKVGKIKTSHGIRGEVFLIVFSKDASWIKSGISIFLSKDEANFSPVVLKKVKSHKEGAIVTIEGVHSRNESDLLIGQEIWVSPDIFVSQDQESLYLIEIEGFEVIDQGQTVGTIQGFSSNGMQDLLLVSAGHQNYEIPFVKEFILEIDHKNKVIKTQLPVGLLEINSIDDED